MAKTMTISTTGVHQIGEADTIAGAKEKAHKEAVSNAIEQADIYVRSYMKSKNMQLMDDQIRMISTQTIQIKGCQFYQENQNIYTKLIAVIDSEELQERINENKDFTNWQIKFEEKNQAHKDKELQRIGYDTVASSFAKEEVKKMYTKPGQVKYSKIAYRNFKEFVEKRNGDVPAYIYSYMALLDALNLDIYDKDALDSSSLFDIDIQKAIDIVPNDPLYDVLFAIKCGLSNNAAGMNDFSKKALVLNKNYWPAQYIYAICLRKKGFKHSALKEYELMLQNGGKQYANQQDLFDCISTFKEWEENITPKEWADPYVSMYELVLIFSLCDVMMHHLEELTVNNYMY